MHNWSSLPILNVNITQSLSSTFNGSSHHSHSGVLKPQKERISGTASFWQYQIHPIHGRDCSEKDSSSAVSDIAK